MFCAHTTHTHTYTNTHTHQWEYTHLDAGYLPHARPRPLLPAPNSTVPLDAFTVPPCAPCCPNHKRLRPMPPLQTNAATYLSGQKRLPYDGRVHAQNGLGPQAHRH